jgi:hypothetical protein
MALSPIRTASTLPGSPSAILRNPSWPVPARLRPTRTSPNTSPDGGLGRMSGWEPWGPRQPTWGLVETGASVHVARQRGQYAVANFREFRASLDHDDSPTPTMVLDPNPLRNRVCAVDGSRDRTDRRVGQMVLTIPTLPAPNGRPPAGAPVLEPVSHGHRSRSHMVRRRRPSGMGPRRAHLETSIRSHRPGVRISGVSRPTRLRGRLGALGGHRAKPADARKTSLRDIRGIS